MSGYEIAAPRAAILRGTFGAASVVLSLIMGPFAWAEDRGPIKIGVIAEAQAVAGSSIPQAAELAANEDHVNAVIASYVSEVVLALEPWSARLKTVLITPGAASDVITANIAKDYEHNKYTFHGYLTSSAIAGLVCDAGKDMLIDGLKMKTAVIMSEDAAWTTPLDAGYEACLPKIGFTVLDHIRF